MLTLRDENLGVPVLAYRVGSGPAKRSRYLGAAGAVLARLTRLCGADVVIASAFGGKLFDSDTEVEAEIAAIRERELGVLPATAALGGGIGPDNAREQAERTGGEGVLLLLGSAADLRVSRPR